MFHRGSKGAGLVEPCPQLSPRSSTRRGLPRLRGSFFIKEVILFPKSLQGA